jgi:hypothetical protein
VNDMNEQERMVWAAAFAASIAQQAGRRVSDAGRRAACDADLAVLSLQSAMAGTESIYVWMPLPWTRRLTLWLKEAFA